MKNKLYQWMIYFGFILLWLNNDASPATRNAVKTGTNQLFNEPNQSNYIDYAALPQYELISNTNIVGRLLVIDERQLQNLNVNLSNVTVAKLNTWKDTHLAPGERNYLRWDRGDNWQDVVAANGMRLVQDGSITNTP